jgi:hypothetical protein
VPKAERWRKEALSSTEYADEPKAVGEIKLFPLILNIFCNFAVSLNTAVSPDDGV